MLRMTQQTRINYLTIYLIMGKLNCHSLLGLTVEYYPKFEAHWPSTNGSHRDTHRKAREIFPLLLEARLLSDKLAPVSSRQAWNDCLFAWTFALSRPVKDWERWRSFRCSSAIKNNKIYKQIYQLQSHYKFQAVIIKERTYDAITSRLADNK